MIASNAWIHNTQVMLHTSTGSVTARVSVVCDNGIYARTGTVEVRPYKAADGTYHSDYGGAMYVFRAMGMPKLYTETFTRKGWGYRIPISISSENPIKLIEKE